MKRQNTEKMLTVTLTIDFERHQRLKETARITRFSMSEITRLALDRLWNDLGDISEDISAEAAKILFPKHVPVSQKSLANKGENI
ncbi:MAG TPA: hypothetical protein VGB00_14035 [Pyrinomonadaceae bacterium]|jgi:hypothetical protein